MIVAAIALVVGAVRPVCAQETPPPALVAEVAELDAGEVLEGEDPRYTFTLVNQTEQTLKLRVVTFCGCTIARFDPEIAPGGRSTLEATLETKKLKGKVTKAIVVQADDPAKTKVQLRVMATVRPLIRVEPQAAFVIVKDRAPNRVEFTLTPEPGKGIAFTEAISSDRYFIPKLLPQSDGTTKLVVAVTPDAPPGHLQANIAVGTTSTTTPRLMLVVTGEKGITFSPRMVFWSGISANSSAAREEILLRKRGGRFAIRAVRSEDPAIRATVETVEEGTHYRVVVTYVGGWQPGRARTSLVVETDDPFQPEITIPVQAVINAAVSNEGARS